MSRHIVGASSALLQERRRLALLVAALRPIAAELEQPQAPLDEAAAAIDRMELRVLVTGEVNRGKSTFLNALIGVKLFPPRASVCTAVLTCLRDGTPPRASLRHRSGKEHALQLSDNPAKQLLTVVGKKNRNAKDLTQVNLWFPNKYARDGVVIVDTPGVNDREEWRERVTIEALSSSDAVVFLLDAQKPLTATEMSFLRANVMTGWGRQILFIINKADTLAPAERQVVMERCQHLLSQVVDNPSVHFVASRPALKAITENNDMAIRESGLPEVADLLRVRLVDERLALYARDRTARLHALAFRYLGAIEQLLAELQQDVDTREARHTASLRRLQRRESELDARQQSLRKHVSAHARFVAAEAVAAWDQHSASILAERVKAITSALERSLESGQEEVQSTFAHVWQRTRAALESARSTDLRQRFQGLATGAGASMRKLDRSTVTLPATLRTGTGGGDDAALIGLVAGAAFGALTGGIGWAILGGLGGLAMGNEVAGSPSVSVDRVLLRAEIEKLSLAQRSRLRDDAESTAHRSAARLVKQAEKHDREVLSSEQATVTKAHRLLSQGARHAEVEKARLQRLAQELHHFIEELS